jgi:hypothetical protein
MSATGQALPEVRPDVAAVAQQQGLGQLRHAPTYQRQRKRDTAGIIIAGPIFIGLSIVSLLLLRVTRLQVFLWIAISLFALGLALTFHGIRLAIVGTQYLCVYEGGLVVQRKGPPRVVTWSDVEQLQKHIGGERSFFTGQLVAFTFITRDGKPVKTGSLSGMLPRGELHPVDTFMMQSVAAAGGRVT